MDIYVIKHNVEDFLPFFRDNVTRRFTDLRKANQVFESISRSLDYSKDEWISLTHIKIVDIEGELHEDEVCQLRMLSDDTKIGVNFNVETYQA
ncbi:MAG: hypothetical protein HDS07_00560 [Bacteroides sp.]|nr:hypothetical protein [Bacteroides sp.]